MTLIRILYSRTYPILQKKSATKISSFSNYFQRCRTFARDSSRTPFHSSRSNDFLRGKLPAPENEPVYQSSLLKQFLFTAGFSGAVFVGVTIWEYENYRSQASGSFIRSKTNDFISELKFAWHSLPVNDKFFVPICALNLLVFGLWRIPSLKGFMYRYFCSNPASQSTCLPMVFSTFSHYSLFHIFANMYVLHSFSHSYARALGIEQATGVYLTAGIVSSLVSYIYKKGIGVPGYSLGASGAIMAVLGYVCTRFPDTQINIIFLPMFQFTADSAIKGIVALDLVGCILGWKFFDHAAHLGGALFGIFWCYYGKEIWSQRKPILHKWHEIRSGKN